MVHPAVARFYEHTADYTMDAWSHWCGAFRPFGTLLALLFSRRLHQLNVPLNGLNTSEGLTSEIIDFVEPEFGEVRHTAWFRRLVGPGHVLYAGFYSVCRVPHYAGNCVKVVFPLPNGNAIVIMKPQSLPDGSVVLRSSGNGFGEPGFYFTVHNGSGKAWVRYVRALRESIHVFPDDEGGVRADHVLWFWGIRFLRLHYRMRPISLMHLPLNATGASAGINRSWDSPLSTR